MSNMPDINRLNKKDSSTAADTMATREESKGGEVGGYEDDVGEDFENAKS